MKLVIVILVLLVSSIAYSQSEQKELYPKRNSNHKKIFYEYTHGLGSWDGTCDKAVENYRYNSKSIAACIVSRRILLKAKTHNSWVHFRMFTLYGSDWRTKVKEACDYEYDKPNQVDY